MGARIPSKLEVDDGLLWNGWPWCAGRNRRLLGLEDLI
jgi:hypothetical protein